MHIPDGYLDPTEIVLFAAVSAVFVAVAIYQMKRRFSSKAIPIFAVLTASVFAFQMLNFPIVGGTSGHLVGSTLISIILGPFGGIISLVLILVTQAFVFADGGVTALGANIFNMGIVGSFVGYYFYLGIRRLLKNRETIWQIRIAAGVASWCSVVIAAFVCGLELGYSTNFPYGAEINAQLPYELILYGPSAFWALLFPHGLGVTVTAMVGWHMIIGVGEGIITVAILEYVQRVRPDLLLLPKVSLKGLFSRIPKEEEETEEPTITSKSKTKTRTKSKTKIKTKTKKKTKRKEEPPITSTETEETEKPTISSTKKRVKPKQNDMGSEEVE
jgi:cobalt/nickel transport system permease protein